MLKARTFCQKVPGQLDASWSDWAEGATIAVDSEVDDEGNRHPVTTLTDTFDQAALQGLQGWLGVDS